MSNTPTQNTNKEDTTKTPNRSLSVALTSLLGIASIILIAFLLNFLLRQISPLRRGIDLTENKNFTLSEGTKSILNKIPEIKDPEGKVIPVEVRYYFTKDDPRINDESKLLDRTVQDLLDRYQSIGKNKLNIRVINPVVDSDEEDEAVADGISADPDGARHGLAVSYLEKQIALPFLSKAKETLLEYDLSRAIIEVTKTNAPKIGIISSLPIHGSPNANMPPQFGGGGPPEWVIHQELTRSFEVSPLPPHATEIDSELETLLLIHPTDLSDETLFAIDQFLLNGGNLIALIDPNSFIAKSSQPRQNPTPGAQPPKPIPTASNIEKLLTTWGLSMSDKVVGDQNLVTTFAQNTRRIAALTIGPESMNQDDILTSQINEMFMLFAGAIEGKPADGLTMTPLIQSSEKSALINSFDAEENSPGMVNTFTADNTKKNLAVRLRGKFKTAFPDGKPTESDTETKEEKGSKDEDTVTEHLKESIKESSVILVTDVDWVSNPFSVQIVPDMAGAQVAIPRNENLSFFLNSVDYLSGDSDLISIRSRASNRRPFGKIKQLEAIADQNMRAEINEFTKKREKAQKRIQEIQKQRASDDSSTFLSPEQESELQQLQDEYVTTGKQLRETRKELRKDITRLHRRVKVANIVLVPLLVAFLGLGVAFYRKTKTSASN